MPVPAVSEGLSKGVIDGTTIPWEVTTALKVAELVGNHTEFEGAGLYTLSFVLAMNKEKYESLPDDLKKIIDDNSGLELSVFAGGTQLMPINLRANLLWSAATISQRSAQQMSRNGAILCSRSMTAGSLMWLPRGSTVRR